MIRPKIDRSAAPPFLATTLCVATIFLTPQPAAAQVYATDPVSDGTGGPSTLTPPASVDAPEARESLTAAAQTTVDPSTGFALSSFGFQLPRARGGAQPSLALTYNSSNATVVGYAGLGWTLSIPAITRRGAAGLPLFTDDVFTAGAALANPAAAFDEYLADGHLLVPICPVSTCAASQLVAGEHLPTSLAGASLAGWIYFRREVDDGARYFFAPDGQTWIRQDRSGIVSQYGHPLDGGQVDPSLSDGLERPASGTNFAAPAQGSTAVSSWHLVRQADAVGNTVYYTWTDNSALSPAFGLPGTLYLSDVYDTLGVGQSPAPSAFAHHAHLTWQLNFPITQPIATPVWRAAPLAQLATVDVTSASWASAVRSLVRRYSISYAPNAWSTRNRPASITLEGECAGANGVLNPVPEANNLVPNPSGCASPSVLTLAQYAYSPDASSSTSPSIAWTLPGSFVLGGLGAQDPGFIDMNGDGAADFAFLDPTGHAIDALPFSAPSNLQFSDPTPGSAIALAYGTQTSRENSPLIYGDWQVNGFLNWLVYSNQWGAYSPSGGTFVGGPLQPSNCQTGTCAAGKSWDVDGDGLTDSTFASGLLNGDSNTFLTQRMHGGGIVPFALAPPTYLDWENYDLSTWLVPPGCIGCTLPNWRSIADVDGDGLADSVYAVDRTAFYSAGVSLAIWLNHGDGAFGTLNPNAQSNSIVSDAIEQDGFVLPYDISLTTEYGNDAQAIIRMADVNLDGVADIVKLTSTMLYVCPGSQNGYGFNECIFVSLPANQPADCGLTATDYGPVVGPFLDPVASFVGIADIDGSGVPSIVFSRYASPQYTNSGQLGPACADTFVYRVVIAPGTSTTLGIPPTTTFPGLLTNVTLLGGERQTITYQPVHTLPLLELPTAAWVVTNVQSTNSLPAPQLVTSNVSYSYAVPVYDPRDKQFVGFQSVQEKHSGDVGAPGLVRTTAYATSACGESTGTSCTGQIDYGWFRTIRGLPVSVSDYDTSGAFLQATTMKYNDHVLYTGMDGREVRKLPMSEKMQYQGTPATKAKTVELAPFVSLGASTYEVYSGGVKIPVTVPSTTPVKKVTFAENDLGDQLSTVDFGQPGVDVPIRTDFTWELPKGDTTRWSYRVKTKTMGYTTTAAGGTIQPPAARSTAYTYTALGQLLTETAAVSDPAPMSAADGFAAGTPPDATTATSVCIVGCPSGGVTGIQYDGYGNPTTTPRANGRCAGTVYDPLFAQFAQTSLAYQSGCGSTNPIQTTAIYDRGLEQITQKTSATVGVIPLVTLMRYESFGRLAEVDQPSADVPGLADTSNPALLIQYNDSGLVRQIYSLTLDGTEVSPLSQAHYKYVDGFGDTLAAIDQAGDPSSPQWIVSGAHTRYSNGQRKQSFMPAFQASAAYSFGGSYAGHTMTYDGAGRVLTDTDADAFTTTYSYQFGLATAASLVRVTDPEQTSGSHVGAYTTSSSDGHGRVIQTDRHVVHSQLGAGDLVTTTAYTAVGERRSITQTYPGGSNARQMTWDTLGRMVAQTEPNTGTWQYAYNDSGDLVGRMDARGCGEVVYHDALGRVTAEDYSPCGSSDSPAYSAPNLITGDGTESFYVYDGYGNVAREADRAQSSSYSYDPRNRLTSVQRQIAVPGGAVTLAARYAPEVYTKQVLAYSEANRPLTSSTGAELADLQVGGQSQVAMTYAINGALESATSSYGALLVHQATDASGRITSQTFGDAANTSGSMSYDNNGWLVSDTLQRAPGPWTAYAQEDPPSASDYTEQGVLLEMLVSYDMVGNPTLVSQPYLSVDGNAGWPTGAQPFTVRFMAYWDDYRLSEFSPAFAGGGYDAAGISGNPYTPAELASATYPALSHAATGVRLALQTFGYDLRGNVVTSNDDAHDLWDRSLGAVTYAPNTDQLATTAGGGAALYDPSGNVTTVTTATGITFELLFDEVGRLAKAVREDPTGTMVSEAYTYDASGERIVTDKTPTSSPDVYTVNVFNSLVLKNAVFPDANGDYEHDDSTEQVYLVAGGQALGRAFYAAGLPSGSSSNVHVFMTLGDQQGSTSFVIDRGTGELVEAISYLPYGGADSDYRPTRWNTPREDVRYTGQWDNAEVGLVYMHARYYSPELGRFVSPDPLAVQGGKGDLNPYAYAGGSPFRYTDPSGFLGEAADDTSYQSDADCQSTECGAGTLQVPQTTIQGQKSLPFGPPNAFDTTSAITSSYSDSGNMFSYSPGFDTTIRPLLTPGQLQDQQVAEFAFIGQVATAAFVAPEPFVESPLARGNQFEAQGLDIIGGAKNTRTFSVPVGNQTVGTIPDNIESDMFGNAIGDFKDQAAIYNTAQLRAQQALALQLGEPFNLYVSPNNQTISAPLWRGIQGTGGGVYVLDPNPITIDGD